MKPKHEPPPTVLVVDDEAAIRQVVSRVLCEEGYHVWQAADLDGARAHLLRAAPTLALLDVQVGKECGFDLLEELGSSTAVIMMSGAPEMQWQAESRGLPFLPKPFSVAQLLAAADLFGRAHRRAGRWPSFERAAGQNVRDRAG
jgi:DNA-binding response OmpR family regulator